MIELLQAEGHITDIGRVGSDREYLFPGLAVVMGNGKVDVGGVNDVLGVDHLNGLDGVDCSGTRRVCSDGAYGQSPKIVSEELVVRISVEKAEWNPVLFSGIVVKDRGAAA